VNLRADKKQAKNSIDSNKRRRFAAPSFSPILLKSIDYPRESKKKPNFPEKRYIMLDQQQFPTTRNTLKKKE
jgi:hypothetical protein